MAGGSRESPCYTIIVPNQLCICTLCMFTARGIAYSIYKYFICHTFYAILFVIITAIFGGNSCITPREASIPQTLISGSKYGYSKGR